MKSSSSLIMITVLTASILMVIGCAAPFPVTQFKPASGSKYWDNGRQVTITEEDSIKVLSKYVRSRHDELVIHLDIANNSKRTLTIDPKTFYYTVYRDGVENRSVKRFAIDPELVLSKIAKQKAQTESEYSKTSGVNMLFRAITLVTDIAAAGSDETEAEREERRETKEDLEEAYERDDERFEKKMANLNNSELDIEYGALRKTTLFPGMSVSGDVHFKKCHVFKTLKFYLPISKTIQTFKFHQVGG